MAFPSSDKTIQVWGRFVIAAFVIFVLDGVGVLGIVKYPVERSLNFIGMLGRPLKTLLNQPYQGLKYYRSGTARIIDLENRLAEAIVDRGKLLELEAENQDLRKLLDAPLPQEWSYIVAPVLGRQDQEMILSVGTADGVSLGDSVIYQDTLVGKIKTASAKQSRMLLVTAPASRIAVFASANRVDGLVTGTGQGLVLSQVLQSSKVEVGQILVTSGLDGTAPRLVVGRVESLATNEQGLFQEAPVSFDIEPSSFNTVFIIKN